MSAGTDNQPYADNEQRQRQPLSHRSADSEEADKGVGLAEYFNRCPCYRITGEKYTRQQARFFERTWSPSAIEERRRGRGFEQSFIDLAGMAGKGPPPETPCRAASRHPATRFAIDKIRDAAEKQPYRRGAGDDVADCDQGSRAGGEQPQRRSRPKDRH